MAKVSPEHTGVVQQHLGRGWLADIGAPAVEKLSCHLQGLEENLILLTSAGCVKGAAQSQPFPAQGKGTCRHTPCVTC